MFKIRYLALFLIFFSIKYSFANDPLTTMSDYLQRGITEVAASPPLILLKNEKSKSRHEIIGGIIETKTDGTSTITGGEQRNEKGDASGFGLGYGYTHSFKEKWAFFLWLQGAMQDGKHTQSKGNLTTSKVDDIAGVTLNLSFGVSYEFLRDSENHTLNLFGGPSVIFHEVSGAIQTFNNNTGLIESAFDASFDGFLPAITIGSMYEYKIFEDFQIIPYGILVLNLADECQVFRSDNIGLNQDGTATTSSPICGGGIDQSEPETDFALTFATIGIKFNYIPWDLGFNISGLIRDALLRSDDEDRAAVNGVFFSLSKSWGDK